MIDKKSMYQDLLKAQTEIETVGKDGKNPYFKSDYTTLNATINACKEVLNKNNFIVLQPIESDADGVYVCTTLIHTSGEVITSRMRLEAVKSNDPQAQGSAITYARRYSLKSMLCMSDNDDDGEKAMSREVKQPVIENNYTDKPNTRKCDNCGGEFKYNSKYKKWLCAGCNKPMNGGANVA